MFLAPGTGFNQDAQVTGRRERAPVCLRESVLVDHLVRVWCTTAQFAGINRVYSPVDIFMCLGLDIRVVLLILFMCWFC